MSGQLKQLLGHDSLKLNFMACYGPNGTVGLEISYVKILHGELKVDHNSHRFTPADGSKDIWIQLLWGVQRTLHRIAASYDGYPKGRQNGAVE